MATRLGYGTHPMTFAIQVDGVGMMQFRPGDVVLGKLFQRVIQRLTTASRGC
jgi:hypothetical protein